MEKGRSTPVDLDGGIRENFKMFGHLMCDVMEQRREWSSDAGMGFERHREHKNTTSAALTWYRG